MMTALSNLSRRGKAAVVAVLALSVLAPIASASTPTMDAVTFPLDVASIVTAVSVAGATMLAAWAGLWVAFRLIKKLISRVGSAV